MDDFWNLFPQVIFGREGDEGADESGDEGDNDDDEGDPAGDENTNDDANKSDKSGDNDIEALKKALAAERRQNKKNARALAQAQAQNASKEQTDNEDLEETKKKLIASTEKTQKLASGLLKRTLDSAIKDAARDLKFIDVEDAVAGVDRSLIEFDQDDEDPSDIDLDVDSVVAAVKKLAAKKAHFIARGTDDNSPSGSPMGGSRKRSKVNEEDELRSIYPNL